MLNTKVTVSEQSILKFSGDVLVFFATQNSKGGIDSDHEVKQLLKPFAELEEFSAKPNETVILYPSQLKNGSKFAAARIVVIGVGKEDDLAEEIALKEQFRSIGGTLAGICANLKTSDILITKNGKLSDQWDVIAESLTEGILLGDYRFTKYKKADDENPVYEGIKKLIFATSEKAGRIRKAVKRGNQVADAARFARDMANEPGNGLTATEFAERAERVASETGLNCTIIEKEKMEKLGMGGIIAVNRGSAEPPKLIILDHKPKKAKKTVLLVGKGLTFDSGGVSLKPAAGMQDMKYDMCGGAAVLGAMKAIAEDNPQVRVVGIIPSTDNMSGANALKPGDVIRHYNGVTSEIVNTDAEGRLILADALAYGIEEFKPDYTVDVATLTGAVILGLGHHYTGLLSNNDTLAEALTTAGKACGEPVWRLPLGKEYSKQIESQVADIKNAGGRPAGTITAAAYLEKFVDGTAWAHLDIAGTAWDFTEKTYIPKGPSGIMVRTLVDYVRSLQ